MKRTLIMGLLLAINLVLAATPGLDARYVALVGEDAPTTDVITAANFAATMTGFAKFTAATLEQAQKEYSESDLDEKYLVIIDGNTVLLLGDDEYSRVYEKYFQDAGFAVTTRYAPKLTDLGVGKIEETNSLEADDGIDGYDRVGIEGPLREEIIKQAKVPKPTPPRCEGCVYDDECLTLDSQVVIDGTTHVCTEDGLKPKEDSEPEESGFFVRILSWFANFF